MSQKYDEALERIVKAKKEKSLTLDLSGLELTLLPEPLFELIHLKELYLSHGG